MNRYGTTLNLSPTEMAFITYVVNMDIGISTYFTAVKEGYKDVSLATSNDKIFDLTCSTVIIGAKRTHETYEMNGDLDEIKYFYRALTTAGTLCNIPTLMCIYKKMNHFGLI